MSIANDIRTALRKASGPISAAELREATDDKYTPAQISGNVKALVETGEVIRDATPEGFTYLLDSSYVPKRAAKSEPESASDVPPPAAKAKRAASLKTVLDKVRRKPKTAPVARKKDATTAAADPSRKALECSAQATDDAVEAYLHSVADPAIYLPLKQARDHAREALRAFEAN